MINGNVWMLIVYQLSAFLTVLRVNGIVSVSLEFLPLSQDAGN